MAAASFSAFYFLLHLARGARPTTGANAATDVERFQIKQFSHGLRYSMFRSGTQLAWFLLRGIAMARKFQQAPELAQFYSIYAIAAAEFGFPRHAEKYIEKAIKIARDNEDQISLGVSIMYGGCAYYGLGAYQRAVEFINESDATLSVVGGKWLRHMGKLHRSQSRMMLGNLSDCLVENTDTLRSSIDQGDMRSNCCAYLQTRASEGRFNLDVVLEKMPTNDEDILSTCNLDKARGIRHLYLKRYDEAIKSFERALARPRAALIPNWHVIAGIPFLVQALRLSACALLQSNPTEARARQKRALRLARRGVWICWLFPPEYAFALREYGEVLRDFGKLDKAEKYLRKSCEVSRKYETPYELAKSELSLAEIAVQRGAPGSDEALAAALQRVEAFQSQIGDATRESEKLLAAFCDSLPN
jgi:tetratricopeptide (TPR) repeat protein